MTRFLIAIALVSAMMLVGCSDETHDEYDWAIDEVDVGVGNEFDIVLLATDMEFCQWQLSEPLDEKIVKLVNTEHTEGPSSAIEVWTFNPVSKGKTKVSMEYICEGLEELEPGRTATITIVVK